MKKVFAIFAIAALVACGGASTEATTDTAAQVVDTTNKTTVSPATGGGSTTESPRDTPADAIK